MGTCFTPLILYQGEYFAIYIFGLVTCLNSEHEFLSMLSHVNSSTSNAVEHIDKIWQY
jgi:hypothetical protein